MRHKHSIEELLNNKNWKKSLCKYCGSEFFYKRDSKCCGSYKCEKSYKFLDFPSPNKFSDLYGIEERIKQYFAPKGFAKEEALPVKRDNERTLFISAAGQIFDEIIYGKKDVNKSVKKIIFQPVIRLQGLYKISKLEGISSSFINVGTEIWYSNINEHFHNLDKWFDVFSKLGILVSNLNLKYTCELNLWDNRRVPSKSLKINYRGLEIGIANYFYDIPLNGKRATLSDISIGLERLAWAINRTDSYFDSIGPLDFVLVFEREKLDALRTLTLMAASGVVPSTKNHGQKFRLVCQKLSNPLDVFPVNELVEYYYKQWSHYIALMVSKERVINIISKEIERMKKNSLRSNLNLNYSNEKSLRDLLKDSKLLKKLRNDGDRKLFK